MTIREGQGPQGVVQFLLCTEVPGEVLVGVRITGCAPAELGPEGVPFTSRGKTRLETKDSDAFSQRS